MSGPKWTREGETITAARAVGPGTTEYVMRTHLDARVQGWIALLFVNGEMVHRSEHPGRREAQHAADRAMARARELRELGAVYG